MNLRILGWHVFGFVMGGKMGMERVCGRRGRGEGEGRERERGRGVDWKVFFVADESLDACDGSLDN